MLPNCVAADNEEGSKVRQRGSNGQQYEHRKGENKGRNVREQQRESREGRIRQGRGGIEGKGEAGTCGGVEERGRRKEEIGVIQGRMGRGRGGSGRGEEAVRGGGLVEDAEEESEE